ncbi:MAG TPA: nuclear transport factor 2 family protein [Burkholderiales bacterium]|nr:nuclear transport factor 2 family protein [Burkholderiales bacterium]
MKRSVAKLFVLLLAGLAAEVNAGPAEEVTQLAQQRLQAFHEGNVDGYTAPLADNAVVHSSLSPFRIEGKDAIRANVVELFKLYPGRRVLPRQAILRVYNDDLVVQNSYSALYLTNPKGDVTTLGIRSSVVWAKLSGRWQIVDQHTSRLMAAP